MTVYARPLKRTRRRGTKTEPLTSYYFDFELHGQRHVRGGFRSRKQAQEAQDRLRVKLHDRKFAQEYGGPAAPAPFLRTFLAAEYYPSLVARRLAPKTIEKHKRILNGLADQVGGSRLSEISVRELQTYAASLTSLSANSFRIEWAKVRQMFRFAMRRGHVEKNSALDVALPKETPWPDRILQDGEQGRLLGAFNGRWPQHRAMVELVLYTALRAGEVRDLRGQWVDLAGARLVIPQPKTGRTKVIPLLPRAVEILKGYYKGPAQPVFMSRTGKPVASTTLEQAFHRAVALAQLGKLRIHDLRHTVAVRLLRAGYDLPTVGDILGHKPPYRTTLRYLAHVSEDRKREALEAMASRFVSQLPPPRPHLKRVK